MTNAMNTALAALGISSLRTLLLAGVTGFGLKIFRVKSTAVHLFAWRAVLCASLAMPFLGQLLPPLQIATPQVFRTTTASPTDKPLQAPSAVVSSSSLPVSTKTLMDVSTALPS